MKFVPLAVGFFAAIIVVILFADLGELGPFQVVYSFKYGDKAMHFLLLGALALLVDLALVEALPRLEARIVVIAGSAFIATLTSFEEFSQLWMRFRTADWFDLLASYAGIATATLVALAIADYVRAPKRAPGNTA
jgi:hypothetical protein